MQHTVLEVIGLGLKSEVLLFYFQLIHQNLHTRISNVGDDGLLPDRVFQPTVTKINKISVLTFSSII